MIKNKKEVLIVCFIIILTLFSPLIHSENSIEEGISLVETGRYNDAINILVESCPDTDYKNYNNEYWKCNFYLGYSYENKEKQLRVTGEDIMYLEYNIEDLKKSEKYYKNSIKISDFKQGTPIISDYLFLIHQLVSKGEYNEANDFLNELKSRISQSSITQSADYPEINKAILFFKDIVELNGTNKIVKDGPDILGYSEIQYFPNIIFTKDNNHYKVLNIGYVDRSIAPKIFENNNKIFVRDKPFILSREGIFPFDSYITKPEFINSNTNIKTENYDLKLKYPFKGDVNLKNSEVRITIKRNKVNIIFFLISYLLSLLSIILLFRYVSKMKKSDFKLNNIINNWRFCIPLSFLLFTVASTYDMRLILNILLIPLMLSITLLIIFAYFKYLNLMNRDYTKYL